MASDTNSSNIKPGQILFTQQDRQAVEALQRRGQRLGLRISGPTPIFRAGLRLLHEADDDTLLAALTALDDRMTDNTSWVRSLWEHLASAFYTTDFDRDGRSLMAPRRYLGFDVINLVVPQDFGRISLEVVESPPFVPGVERLSHRFEPCLEDSPMRVATQIAAWIREQQKRRRELISQRIKLVPGLASMYEEELRTGSPGEVERALIFQRLIREEFLSVDPNYEKHQYDEKGNLIYGPTASFVRNGAEFRYELHGCGNRYDEFKAALIRVFDRFGHGEW